MTRIPGPVRISLIFTHGNFAGLSKNSGFQSVLRSRQVLNPGGGGAVLDTKVCVW